jgi:hypothetical protein
VTIPTIDEINKTLLDARQLVLWRIVELLNSKPLDVDSIRSLAASYNLLSQQQPSGRYHD